MARDLARRLRSWEGLLLVLLIVVLVFNITRVPNYLTVINQINLFQLGIEKAIVILAMTFVIIKAIDLVLGLRVEESAEETGLDIAVHGETAYVPWSAGVKLTRKS